jgi:bifunctional DNA-binding transcriptional regulator/antitoxin component of YhaV-PrlF toxin-antitoxin module
MADTAQKPDMASLTKGLTNKSEMMRRLHAAGYSRAEIAKFLGVRYQFVRNVIADVERRQVIAQAPTLAPDRPITQIATTGSVKLKVAADGSVVLPQMFREQLSITEGDSLIGVIENGEVRLFTIPTAIRRAQAIVREIVPEGVSLVDELLEDRRREAERDND